MSDALALLREAKALIASPKTWCQGHSCGLSPDGTTLQRDLLNAILDAGSRAKDVNATMQVLDAVYEETGRFGITAYNDSPHTTHAHIYALIERAERRLR